MNFADRMSRLGTESAFEVLARARALERQGKEIIHLEIGEPDFDTPVHIRDAGKRALDDGFTHYGPAAGLPELREAIAKDVAATRNIAVTPDEIVVTPGAKPIMYFVIHALVNPGDEVIYPNPGFPIYESVINFVGGVGVPIPLREESGFGFDLDLLERKASAKTKLIVINSPQNPTGGVLEVDQLGRIAEIARRYRIPVLTDEIYKSFLYDGEFASITRFPGLEDLLIILDGFSKAYAMTGWRLGYGVMPTPLAEHVTRLMVNSNSCTAAFTQLAGIAALQGDQTPVATMVAEFKRRRDLVVAGLNQLPGVSCRLPRGAFYAFPNVKALGRPSSEVAEALLQEAGVATLAGTAFGEHGEGYLRLSYANSEANLRKALDRMRPVLARLARGRGGERAAARAHLMPTVAQLLVEGLRHAGVARIFGVPGGGSNLELIEAARAQGLPFVLCHQEWAACIMAAVTGELTGRPGAALSTLGPGVTASATGLAYARLDRAPMIYLSDRHPEAALGFTTHQTLDHGAHLGPVVKASLTLAPESASHWIAHAARLALAEPRGPVHLDLPADVADRPALGLRPNPVAPTALVPETARLDQAAAMIRAARRPIVVAGLECRQSEAKWLRAFCEALPAPLLTTYKAKGAIPDPHPLAMGVFTGGVLEEAIVRRADLIIALGLDLVELIPRRWPYSAPVLSFRRTASTDPALAAPGGGTYFTPALEVTGDLALILEELAPRLVRADARADWDVAEVDRLRRQRASALEVTVPGLAPHRVVQITRELMPAGAIATVDAGAHMFPATAYWHAVEPGECLISNGLATMGFALPAAIAAQLVHPERRVVCFTGDGGLLMVASELETAARLRLPITIVVFDDGALSLIQVKQEQKGYADTAMRHEGPDLAALARAFGLVAFAASDEAGLQRALIAALGVPGPTLIAARIDASGYRRMLEIVRGAPAPPSGPTKGG